MDYIYGWTGKALDLSRNYIHDAMVGPSAVQLQFATINYKSREKALIMRQYLLNLSHADKT